MKTFVLLAILVAPALAAVSRDDHPIVKVIAMLEGLKEKAEADGKAEALTYEKFTYWCANSKKSLNKAIAEEKETIEELESLISSKEEAKAVLEKQIGELTDELLELGKAGQAADGDRLDTKNLYDKESKALDDTIKAVKECIVALEGAKDATEELIQEKANRVLALVSTWKGGQAVSKSQLSLLQDFASQRPDQLAKGDRAAHVDDYKFKSQSVIELLKDLEAKFSDEKTECVKAETNSINAYELAKAAREDLENAAKESKKTKEGELGDVKTALNTAEGDLKDERGDLKADSKTLSDTTKQCTLKAEEWAERTATRKGEMEALDTAVKILSKATGVRTEAPSNPVPPPSPVDSAASFLQEASKSSDPKMKAVELIRQEAKVAHSKALEQLAMQVAAHLSGPFDEVNNMIEKMIFRLMDEQKNEDEHKHWCDQELEKTDTSKKDKEDKIDELTAKIDDGKAKSTLLQSDITDADEMVADIVAHMEEATEIRKVGKEENKKAIKDAEDAQAAVSNAIAVLEAFYKESGEVPKEAWEFIQRSHSREPMDIGDEPSTWDSGYTGIADADKQPGGILTVLKKISADFAKMESDTMAQEQTDQDAYDEDMKDCSIEKARRSKESEMKAQEKKRTDEKVASMEKKRKGVEKEHEAVVQYLADLQPACVEGDSTYEDRKAARTKEIDALKKAKGILADAFKEKADGGFLQKRK